MAQVSSDKPWTPIDVKLVAVDDKFDLARLHDFLYILCRDHLPIGTIETIMYDFVDTEPSSYCNTYLEAYVTELTQRLLDLDRPITDWKHMHKSADGDVKWCGEQNRPEPSDA